MIEVIIMAIIPEDGVAGASGSQRSKPTREIFRLEFSTLTDYHEFVDEGINNSEAMNIERLVGTPWRSK
jgi:hypothetical protein